MRTVVLAAVAAVLLTVAPTRSTSPATRQAATNATTRATPTPGEYASFGLDGSAHAAFPATVRLPDGRVRMTWRESSGHLARDGKIMTTVGNPVTGQWATPTELILDTAAPGRDMRPAALSYVNGSVVLTYFFWENGVPAGAYYATSQDDGPIFGNSVRVDGGRPYAAVAAPMVKIGAKLVIPWYGRNPGEALDTVWTAQSMDGGRTWQQNRIANGLAVGKTYTEPWGLVSGKTLMLLYRDGSWNALGMRVTHNGDAVTSSWEPPRDNVIPGATGNSASVWTSSGVIYLVYRGTWTRDAELIASADGGDSWRPRGPIMQAPADSGTGSVGMTYAAPVELSPGVVWCPFGMETSLDSSRLYFTWL